MLTAFCAFSGAAAEYSERAGHGRVTASYHYVRSDRFQGDLGRVGYYTTDSHALDLEVDYWLTNQWRVLVGLPLIMKRFNAGAHSNADVDPVAFDEALHDPLRLVNPRDDPFIDDGKYRTRFQDWRLGVSYRAVEGPILVEPYVLAGLPSNDYPFFGGSAVGQNLWRVAIGSRFAYSPALWDVYLTGSLAYVFVEKTQGVSVNHIRFETEVGYGFTPKIGARVFLIGKQGKGRTASYFVLEGHYDPGTGIGDDDWYYHDKTFQHNYVNAGVAMDWKMTARNELTFIVQKGIHHDEVAVVPYAFGLTMTRHF